MLVRSSFGEYFNVLKREKFAKHPDFQVNAHNLLLDIEQTGKHYQPSQKLNVIKDQSDNKFLELAETCRADYLITGNTNDFTFESFKGTTILTPEAFWESRNVE